MTIPYSYSESLPQSIREKLASHRVTRSLRRPTRVFEDTTDFTSIDYGDIIAVDNRYFLITSYTKEGRFGVDEQIKPWVPKAEELASGNKYILKLVFHETFDIKLGGYLITCYRSPEKEARILELVRGRSHFMQGEPVLDGVGNLLRILEPINGKRLDKYIYKNDNSHEQYFYDDLPSILHRYLDCLQAIDFLHRQGFRHGDIRRDHIFVDRVSGEFSWIDFDYDFYLPEKPFALDLFELGNILIFLVGRGNYHPRDLEKNSDICQELLANIDPKDLSLLSQNRVVNLRKLFPYVPEKLNHILLYFSSATNVFYETVEELLTDLGDALASM
jgi:hypothetical protein